jgi:hypothetical protein
MYLTNIYNEEVLERVKLSYQTKLTNIYQLRHFRFMQTHAIIYRTNYVRSVICTVIAFSYTYFCSPVLSFSYAPKSQPEAHLHLAVLLTHCIYGRDVRCHRRPQCTILTAAQSHSNLS